MKTLILNSKDAGISGFVEYYAADSSLLVSYSIKENIPQNGICKLFALSSKKPFNSPVIADTLEYISATASSSRTISKEALLQNGFDAGDIDSFAVVRLSKAGENEKICGVCFDRSQWDIDGAFFKPVEISELKNPAERGKEILNSIYEKTKNKNPETQRLWLDILLEKAKSLEVSDECPVEGYKWYTIRDIRPPVPLSAYKHLLFVSEVMTEFDKSGFWLFGIKENGRTALAIKSEHRNPFINAGDCAVKTGEYYIVGVNLAADGQYFEKL